MSNKESNNKIEKRKIDHIEICTNDEYNIEMTKSSGFDDILFVHQAAPEIDFDDIILSTKFLDHELSYPIYISPITGGTKEAKKINQILAAVASTFNIGLGVGSQRSAIENTNEIDSFKIVRETAPDIFLTANLGAVQLNYNYGIDEAKKAIEMIDADALTLHLNPLQEIIQPDGNHNFKGLLKKIEQLCEKLDTPIIVKEVGSGISYELANKLVEAQVAAVDIAGAGGTSWAKIESIRAKKMNYPINNAVGDLFADWGITTAASTIEVSLFRDSLGIISSGGIRNGLHAAKALALGANLVGIALPVIRLISSGIEKQLINWLEQFIHELKTAMFLVGAQNFGALTNVPLAIIGNTAQWVSARGIEFQS